MTLGIPRLPENWSNDQVLGFFRLMWQQWLLKSRNGRKEEDSEEARGPAPPAAVAAAAKIALSALGTQPDQLFQTEPHEKPLAEQAPVEPASAALMERTSSGTLSVPLFTVSSEVGIGDFVDGESKVAAMTNRSATPIMSTVRSPLENPERRNRNLQWLRLHFRALSDVGRLPFHNADLWQLHQYYFSPPSFQSADEEGSPSSDGPARAPPPTPCLESRSSMNIECAVAFQSLLGEALLAAGAVSSEHSHKRSSMDTQEKDDDGPVAKKAKNLKPRIAYYPRIMVSSKRSRLSLTSSSRQQRTDTLRFFPYPGQDTVSWNETNGPNAVFASTIEVHGECIICGSEPLRGLHRNCFGRPTLPLRRGHDPPGPALNSFDGQTQSTILGFKSNERTLIWLETYHAYTVVLLLHYQ